MLSSEPHARAYVGSGGVGGAAQFTSGAPVDDAGANFESSDNMRLLSFSERRAGPDQFGEFNSDLAFWGLTPDAGVHDRLEPGQRPR